MKEGDCGLICTYCTVNVGLDRSNDGLKVLLLAAVVVGLKPTHDV